MIEIKIPDVVNVEWAEDNFNKTGRCNKDSIYYKKRNGYVDWIDLNSLPKNKRGNIEWDKVNHEVISSINNFHYSFKLKYSHRNNNSDAIISVSLNDTVKDVHIITLKGVGLENLTPFEDVRNYLYEVGDVVNDYKVVERILIKENAYKYKGYKVKCLLSNKTTKIKESMLKRSKESKFKHRLPSKVNALYNKTELHKYIKNLEESKNTSIGSQTPVDCMCPSCDFEKIITANQLVTHGFNCDNCGGNRSYGEKIMKFILEYNSIYFIEQKKFNGLVGNNRQLKIDFYLPKHNIALEIQGLQHYKDVSIFKNSKQTREYDKIKRKHFDNIDVSLIEIDAKISDVDYIIKNIINQLPFIKIPNKCDIYMELEKYEVSKEDVETIVELYKHKKSIKYISEIVNIGTTRIKNILKSKKVYDKDRSNKRKVRCITTGKEFNCITDALREYGMPTKSGNISKAINPNNPRKYAGTLEDGTPLYWEYVD